MTSKRLVLIGGGHAHLGVLDTLARTRPAGPEVVIVSPGRWQYYSGMLPGWMMGQYDLRACRIDLDAVTARAGVRLVDDTAVALDAARRRVMLGSGAEVDYDVLSLDVGSETDVSALAGAGAQLLPVKPLGEFTQRWRSLGAPARGAELARLVVVGGGAGGVEMAIAAACVFSATHASTRVTLVAGAEGVLPDHSAPVRRMALRALSRAAIEVLARRAVGTQGGLVLDSGEFIPAEIVIAASGARAAGWLRSSGLELDEGGFVAVNAFHQSLSHPEVFAAGDVCTRADRSVSRSGVHAVKTGPVLAHNVLAALRGGELQPYTPRPWSLYLLVSGPRSAIASWGPWAVEGAWVRRWKHRIDSRFVERFRAGAHRL
ncbi:MAG: FAD-dependent oxidoreductase [Gammaproteobacteria bacterium]|nr:FAD-dependent oxidoreductase [Gammaproteobacteria bacterium]